MFVLLGVIVIAVHAAVLLLARPAAARAAVLLRRRQPGLRRRLLLRAPGRRASTSRPWRRSACSSPCSATSWATYLGLLVAQLLSGWPMSLLGLARAGRRRHAGGGHRWPIPSRSTRTAPPTSSPPRSSRTCASRSCATAPTGSRPEAALATTWATADARRWTFTLRDRACASTTAARSTRTRWSRTSTTCAQRAALRRPGRARGPARGRAHPRAAQRGPAGHAVPALLLDAEPARAARRGSARPVGTGPFRLGAGAAGRGPAGGGRRATGAARPRLRRVVFRRLPDEDALVRALLAGEVDVTSAVGQERVGRAARPARTITLDSQIGLNLAFLSINNERPPFGDARVRQALARAVDREALVDGLLGGHGEPARNPLPPLLWGYAARTRELILDRPAARRLLARGRASRAASTRRCSGAGHPAALPARAAAPGRSGCAADLARDRRPRAPEGRVASWSDYVDRATRGDYDLAVLGWQADTIRPQRLPLRAARLRVDRRHQPQPLPQRGHGRAAQAGPPRPAIRASARPSIARRRRSSSGTCPGSRSTTCRRSPRTGGPCTGSPSGPTGIPRYRQGMEDPMIKTTAIRTLALAALPAAARLRAPRRRRTCSSRSCARASRRSTPRLDGVLAVSLQDLKTGATDRAARRPSRSPPPRPSSWPCSTSSTARPRRAASTWPRLTHSAAAARGRRRRPAGAGRPRHASPGATSP